MQYIWKRVSSSKNSTINRETNGLRYPLRPEGENKHEKRGDKEYDYVNVTVAGGNTVRARTREQPAAAVISIGLAWLNI